jgi:hypothetical protein
VKGGAEDEKTDGCHGADHGRRREADHPVPVIGSPRVAEAVPSDAERGRISELSRKQQG